MIMCYFIKDLNAKLVEETSCNYVKAVQPDT